jgi:RNA polymerase sigma-70 factor (ECF subfamily)
MSLISKTALLGKFKHLLKQKSFDELPDEGLIKEFVNGSSYSYELIVKRYKNRVFEFIYFQFKQHKQDAEDLTQEVFIQLYRNPNNFRAESTFSSYIFAIAKNIALNHYRTMSRRIQSHTGDDNIDVIDNTCIHLQIVNDRQQQEYINAFNQLNIEEQQIIFLADKECFSYLQLGEILGIKMGTVRSRLSSARTKIANQLRERLDEM